VTSGWFRRAGEAKKFLSSRVSHRIPRRTFGLVRRVRLRRKLLPSPVWARLLDVAKVLSNQMATVGHRYAYQVGPNTKPRSTYNTTSNRFPPDAFEICSPNPATLRAFEPRKKVPHVWVLLAPATALTKIGSSVITTPNESSHSLPSPLYRNPRAHTSARATSNHRPALAFTSDSRVFAQQSFQLVLDSMTQQAEIGSGMPVKTRVRGDSTPATSTSPSRSVRALFAGQSMTLKRKTLT